MTTIKFDAFAKPQRGFSLIEALIAVVVLATGLLALTSLQGALLRSSADAKARSQLAAFAESLLDQARTAGAAGLAPGLNVSPRLATNLQLTAIAKSAGVGSVTETTTVTQFVANAAGVFPASGCTSGCPAPGNAPQFKRVDVTLSWADATATVANRKLTMTTVISPLALSASNVLVDRPPPTASSLFPVIRRPTPFTAGMIPIAMGGGNDTAATNPKPELAGRTSDTLVADTRFEIDTYKAADNLGHAGFVRFNKRFETAYVGCTCQTGTAGFPTTGSSPAVNALLKAAAYRPAYWTGESYSEPNQATSVTSSPDDSVTQSELCDICCRDHKDPAGDAAVVQKFASQLSTHNHYLDPAASPVTSGDYLESCRVIRVNGLWRVTPDPKVQDLALLATDVYPSASGSDVAPADNSRATSPLPSQYGIDHYITYAYDFVKKYFYDKNTTFDRRVLQASDGVDAPDYVPIKSADAKRWLHARAISVDYLEQEALDRIQTAADACTGTTPIAIAQCVLPYVPMAAINVTELATWSALATSETGIVLPPAFAGLTINYGQARLRQYSSGIALFPAINPTDNADRVKDEQVFTLIPTGSRTGLWLTIPNPTGIVFGDATNPIKGYATAPPLTNTAFKVTLSGIPGTSLSTLAIKPSIEVGTTGGSACDPNSKTNSNPYSCSSTTPTAVVLAMGSYNREASTSTGVKPCGGSTTVKKDVCYTYTFANASVDGVPVTASYSVVSGLGTPAEKGTLGSFNLKTVGSSGYPSTLQANFTEHTANATAVCSATNVFQRWTCP